MSERTQRQIPPVPFPPDHVMRRLVHAISLATAGGSGYSMTSVAPNTLVLTDKHRPTWASAIAILSIFVFPPGLLLFLVKTEHTLTITFTIVPGGTATRVSGTANEAVTDAIIRVLEQELSGPMAPSVSASANQTVTDELRRVLEEEHSVSKQRSEWGADATR